MLESEAPGIDQRSDCYVVCFSCIMRYLFGQIEHVDKQAVGMQVGVLVDTRNDRLLVERRQGIVHLLQFFFNLVFQVFRRLVSDFINGAEHQALVGLIRRLLSQNQYGSHNEQDEERYLPFQFAFVHGLL